MRVQKPLMLARRRQLCGEAPSLARPAPPPAPPVGDADIYDLREERRGFAERQAPADDRASAGLNAPQCGPSRRPSRAACASRSLKLSRTRTWQLTGEGFVIRAQPDGPGG